MEIIKFRSQLVAVLEPVRVFLRLAQNTFMRLGSGVLDRLRALQKALRARENALRKFLASSLDAIVVANAKLIKFRSQLVAGLKPVRANLRRAQNTLMRLGSGVVDRPRALQKALRARENELRRFLASSLDAIVITDLGGRFITANSKALDLFGVSETNMKKFTINVFLSHGQTPYFAGHSAAFMRREKRHGECKVRRLDGSLRVAEYAFVAHFLPNRHVCRFHNVRTPLSSNVLQHSLRGRAMSQNSPGSLWSPAVERFEKAGTRPTRPAIRSAL